MELYSDGFEDGGFIPLKFAMMAVPGGGNISFPLRWRALPPGVASLALLVVDPHPVARNWIHWMVLNMPPGTSDLAEGASGSGMPPGSMEKRNSFGKEGYGGPQPPPGSGKHPYVTTLYALDVEDIEIEETPDLAAFESALKGHVLAAAKLTGFFER